MGKNCCAPDVNQNVSAAYRKVLYAVLIINGLMFIIEMISGIVANSVSLQADAIDFLGDTANYGISLIVLSMALKTRAKAALLKGLSMGGFAIWVLASTVWHFYMGTFPVPGTMGLIGFLALLANAVVLLLLWKYREGDSNMRSVWLCSRNDVIGNFAVLLAAAGVFGTQSGWPDLMVATLMALLAIHSAYSVILHARKDLTN